MGPTRDISTRPQVHMIMSGQAKLEMVESNYISPEIQLSDLEQTVYIHHMIKS